MPAWRPLSTAWGWLAGGIIPKLMERVRRGGLLEAFQHKGGRFEKVISTIPLYAVNEDRWGHCQ